MPTQFSDELPAELLTLDPAATAAVRELQMPGEPDLLAQLVTVFLRSGTERLAKLQAALAQQDAATLQNIAHSFKGSSGTLGAQRLHFLCQKLEPLAQTHDWQAITQTLQQLEHEFLCVRAQLLSHLNHAVTSASTLTENNY